MKLLQDSQAPVFHLCSTVISDTLYSAPAPRASHAQLVGGLLSCYKYNIYNSEFHTMYSDRIHPQALLEPSSCLLLHFILLPSSPPPLSSPTFHFLSFSVLSSSSFSSSSFRGHYFEAEDMVHWLLPSLQPFFHTFP